jgi:tetratricopeptide (TPR) repeat protein
MKADPGTQIERAIQSEDWAAARMLIQRELINAPADHWLLSRLALTYYEQRNYRRALHLDARALQIAPYCPLAIWGYAGSLDMLGRDKEALHLYRWLLSWGEEELAYGECGEGIRQARSLIADCHFRIACIWEGRGQRKKALAAYKEHLLRRRLGIRSIYQLREVAARYKRLGGDLKLMTAQRARSGTKPIRRSAAARTRRSP